MSKESYKLKEVIVMSAISVVFGVLYLLWIFVSGALVPTIGPFAFSLLSGLWIMSSLVSARIFQKPGIALIAELIASLTEILVGSVTAGSVIVLGLVQGLGCELVFMLFVYKRWGTKAMIVSGMAGTMANFLTQYFIFDWALLSTPVVIGLIVTMLISGALAALWSAQIANALKKTGVLNDFAIVKNDQVKI